MLLYFCYFKCFCSTCRFALAEKPGLDNTNDAFIKMVEWSVKHAIECLKTLSQSTLSSERERENVTSPCAVFRETEDGAQITEVTGKQASEKSEEIIGETEDRILRQKCKK